MANNPDLISVVISCYNHENYIQQCIMSVLNQTYKNIELIVADDGSTDGSFTIIETLSKEYNFKAISHPNMGLAKSLNHAIENYVSGEWICCVASDDVWDINKLQLQMQFAIANPRYALLCGKAKYMDKYGLIGKTINFENKVSNSHYNFENLLLENKIVALTVMFKKTAWLHVGGYDENSFIEDWDFWLSVSNHFEIGYQDAFLGYWRQHESNSSNNALKMSASKMYIVNKWKTHTLYEKAYEKHFLETIRVTAGKHKEATLTPMVQHLKYWYKAAYIKALFKVLLLWR